MQEEIIQTIEPNKLEDDALILDVRTNQEHNELSLNRPHWHIPMDELNTKNFIKHYHITEKKCLNILCRSGHRAQKVAEKFKQEGVDNIKVISGGILRAKEQGLSILEHPTWSLRRKLEFTAGALIFIGTLLSLFISKTFYLIPLAIGFILILKSISGKTFLENIIKLFLKD
jgi:rhodanese-related sulfurtransferase